VEGLATGDLNEDADLARGFWEAVAIHFPAWGQVRGGRIPASEVREGFIHSHGIALQAIARAGNALLKKHPNDWKKRLALIAKIDWSRSNAVLWEGRALIGGKVSKSSTNVTLTCNVVKEALRLPLEPEEEKVEKAYRKRART
jgi:DNA sulfur modification protein DndB